MKKPSKFKMGMAIGLKSIIILCFLLTLPAFVSAVPISQQTYGTSAEDYLSGTLTWASTNSQLISTEGWAPASSIAWEITNLVSGNWKYQYTWTATNKELSHIIIELTDGTHILSDSFYSGQGGKALTAKTYAPSDPGNSNPGLPALIYGVKVEDFGNSLSYTFSFEHTNAPVWGNFYAKDGKDGGEVYSYNEGFGKTFGYYIARPNGHSVPEPGTILLLGAGLAGLAAYGFKRRA